VVEAVPKMVEVVLKVVAYCRCIDVGGIEAHKMELN